MLFSLSELGSSGHNSVERIARVTESRVVARTPRELGADSREDAVLNVIFGGDVTELLVDGAEGLSAGHQVEHLEG